MSARKQVTKRRDRETARKLKRGNRINFRRAFKDLPRTHCWTPTKVRYRSQKAADTAAEKQWIYDKRILYTYPCGDHWHLTSQKPEEQQRILYGYRGHCTSA